MTTYALILGIILGALLLAAPILASLTICVPKWYRSRVKPGVTYVLDYIPPVPTRTRRVLLTVERGLGRVARAVAVVVNIILLPISVVVVTLSWYFSVCRTVVTRTCPYTDRGPAQYRSWSYWWARIN